MGRVRLLLFGAILFVQVATPLLLLGPGRGGRFGWHMFSSIRAAPGFAVRHGDVVDTVALDDFVAKARPEIPLDRLLPPHLCDVVEGAESVVVFGAAPDAPLAEVPCPAA